MTPGDKRVDLTGWPVNDSPTPVNWRGKIIHVRPIINPEEVISLVNSVVDACYSKEHDAIVPEMSDFAFREHIVIAYSDVRLPDGATESYRILYLTDIFDVILKHACKAQIDAARRAVDMMIYHI